MWRITGHGNTLRIKCIHIFIFGMIFILQDICPWVSGVMCDNCRANYRLNVDLLTRPAGFDGAVQHIQSQDVHVVLLIVHAHNVL